MTNYWEVDGVTYSDGPSDEGRGVRHLANRGFNRWLVPMFAALGAKAVQTVQAAEAAALDAAAAEISAGQASDSVLSVQTAQAAAETARNKAADWAGMAEDTPVEVGLFSALHWARKALGYAQQAAATIGGLRVSVADQVPSVLASKLVVGASLTATVTDPGGNEQMVINARLASGAEALAGADAEKLMTPATTLPVAVAAAAAALAQTAIVDVIADTALVAGRTYRLRGAVALTLTLPAAPAEGDTIRLLDGESLSATVQHTVARNGQTIMGLAEDLTLDKPGIYFQIWFNGSDWRLF